jgi:hypothetical protein
VPYITAIVASSTPYVVERYALSRTTPSCVSMAMRITMNICARTSTRWVRSSTGNRFVNSVVCTHTHQSAANTAAIHATRVASCVCDTAELRIRMAATNTRS